MITSKEEYLQRLADIQNQANLKELVMLPSDEPRFVIDANSRTIAIPDEFTFLGVENDHAAETIYFEIDRYFDQHDLSTEMCVVQFESVNKNGDYETVLSDGFYPITKIDVDSVPGKVLFGWTILSDVTAHDADVKFSVRFYSVETDEDGTSEFTYNFNTLPSSLPVKKTINATGTGTKVDPSDLEILTARFAEIEQRAKDSISVSEANKDASKEYADAAKVSADKAKASEDIVAASASEAKESEQKAKESELASAESAKNAKSSETNAAASEAAAATSEANAATSESNAADSAAAALASQKAAKDSEDAAKVSENNAADSASAASDSQTAASASETAAKASADASAESQTKAAESEKNAKDSETAADVSAKNAATSANDAADSATTATNAATTATTKATEAGTSATNAATSEKNAADSATAAADSQTKSKASEDSAAEYAEAAKETVSSKGWLWLSDDDNSGTLYLNISENLVDSVSVQDDGSGNLEVVLG